MNTSKLEALIKLAKQSHQYGSMVNRLSDEVVNRKRLIEIIPHNKK